MVPSLVQALGLWRPEHWSVWTLFTVVGVALVLVGTVDRVALVQALSSVRTVLEAGLIGLSLSAAAWRLVFLGVTPQDAMIRLNVTMAIDGFVVGLTILSWVRNRDLGLSIAATGACALIVADLVGAYRLLTTGSPTVVYAAVAALAWPIVLLSLARVGSRVSELLTAGDAASERRSLTIVSTCAIVCGSAVVWSLWHDRHDDPVMWWYTGGILALVAARELVRASQAKHLLLSLTARDVTDLVTGLPNAQALDRDLALAPPGAQLHALTTNLTRFNEVNHSHGRAVGDDLLRAVARGLSEAAQTVGGSTYRIGADEFVQIVRCSRQQAHDLARRHAGVVSRASRTVPALTRQPVTSATGLASARERRPTTDDLLRMRQESTLALQHARAQSLPSVVFEESLGAAKHRRLAVERSLRACLAEGPTSRRLEMAYQPIWSLAHDQLVGVEALARLHDPDLGAITPAEFIPVAEHHGLITAFGQQILRRALDGATCSGLIAAGKMLSVNVPVLQLRDDDFLQRLDDTLLRAGVPASQLSIEITESVFVSPDPATLLLARLQERGITVVLDDFGTGFSSLSYLTRLPVGGLKLDRSLTLDLTNRKTQAIARSIAQLADHLELDVVVEGVEDAEQEHHVRAPGFDRVQGWLYGRPVDAERLASLVAARAQTRPLA